MAKLAIKKGATDVTMNLFIQDSSVSTGAGLTGLTFETASLTCYYVRLGAAAVEISLVTQTVTGAHSDGGFVEIDSTNMPGVYGLDLPDAVCATGVPSAVVMLKGAENMAPVLLEIQLTDFDLNDNTEIAAIKAKTDQLTFSVANKVDATASAVIDEAAISDIVLHDIWSYKTRTLTHPSVSAEEPEGSNTLILYRDADIAIELSDLAIPAGAKKYIFTVKDNLDSGDDQAVLQASYAIDGSEVETNTLVYINSAAAPVLTNPVTFTLTDTNITIDLTAEAAALLPRYERGYLNWDLKLVTDASVTIVLQGLAQIIGTSTRAIE